MKVKLKDVCERGSSNLKQSDVLKLSGNYPIYGAAGCIGNADFYHQENPYIAVVKDGAGIGRTTLHPAKSSIIGTMQYLLPKDCVLVEYLYYVVKHMHLEKYYTGATIPHIYFKDYKEEEFNLASLEKQAEIISVLKKCEKIIEARKQEIFQLENLVKARFVELFGDPATPGEKFKISKLGEVADVKSSHRVFTTEFVDEGVPFYRGTEIGVLASGQQPEKPYRISMEHYLKIANDDSKPMRGDLLLPSICNKGQVWMVDTDEPFYYKDGRVLCISPDRSVFDPRYLQFYMKMRTEAEYPKLGSGSTFAEFKIFQLKELEVDIPSMNTQKAFNLFADQVDKSKVAVQKSLDKAQQLFDSLMQKYFG